jgi:hypothetical protein
MADRLRVELDLLLPAEVEDRFPCVLEPILPAARHSVIGLAPAELVDEPPCPLAPVRNHEILYVQISLAIVGVLLDVQEVGSVRRQDRFDS